MGADKGPAESWFTALVANGEGWHNWHHCFGFDYATSEHGALRQWNPSKVVIDVAAYFGLVTNRKRAVRIWERCKLRQLEREQQVLRDEFGTEVPSADFYRTVIPDECLTASLSKSALTLIMDVFLIIAAGWGFYYLTSSGSLRELRNAPRMSFAHAALWGAYATGLGTLAVRLYVVGYEAACGRLTSSPAVNTVAAFLLHSISLVPFKRRHLEEDCCESSNSTTAASSPTQAAAGGGKQKQKQKHCLSRALREDCFGLRFIKDRSVIQDRTPALFILACFAVAVAAVGFSRVAHWYLLPVVVQHVWLCAYSQLLESPLTATVVVDAASTLGGKSSNDEKAAPGLDPSTLDYFTFDWVSRHLASAKRTPLTWASDLFHHHLHRLHVLEPINFKVPFYHVRDAHKAVSWFVQSSRKTIAGGQKKPEAEAEADGVGGGISNRNTDMWKAIRSTSRFAMGMSAN
eukprot:GHVU01202924.1.p1 GENE.GHVU01202924.1~~GHVU01202924.1.p1  ORF type:complete len:471 (-),score=88.12 GHVU01202924.1:232-1614(-)